MGSDASVMTLSDMSISIESSFWEDDPCNYLAICNFVPYWEDTYMLADA